MPEGRPISEVRKQVHDYLATHPEVAKALRKKFGITSAAMEDDAVRKLARELAQRKKK